MPRIDIYKSRKKKKKSKEYKKKGLIFRKSDGKHKTTPNIKPR